MPDTKERDIYFMYELTRSILEFHSDEYPDEETDYSIVWYLRFWFTELAPMNCSLENYCVGITWEDDEIRITLEWANGEEEQYKYKISEMIN